MFQKFHRLFNQHKTLHVNPKRYSGYAVLKQLGIQPGPPVIVFNSRGTQFKNEDFHLKRMIQEGIGRPAGELRAIVVDGGTDSGMLGLLNSALRVLRHPGLYIGVAPDTLTHLPDQPNPGHLITLGDAHTHFVLVEGDDWGVEMLSMYDLIYALAEKEPYVKISMENRNGIATSEEKISSDGHQSRIKVTESNDHLGDMISLELCYSGNAGNPGSEKIVREEIFSVIEIEREPERLASRIKYFLKMYSATRRDS